MNKILFLVFLLGPVIAGGQVITTFAGNSFGSSTGDGGQATNANISYPIGINFDNNGNLLICHPTLVRKVNISTNIIMTVAGSDTASSLGGGGNGGPATNAQLVSPYGVCVDALGNFYIADYWTNSVRKVNTVTGIIDIYAGSTNGNTGDGGPATAAKFGAGVTAVRMDTARNSLYVSDAWNYRVRRINMTTGIITAFAGTGTNGFDGDGGPASTAKFSRVFGLGLDKAGNVYIGDWDNHRIRKVDIATGVVTTVAGNGSSGFGGDGGPATAAMLTKPAAICFDTCGNLYFSDEENNRVRKIDASTRIIRTIAGNGTPGFSGDGGAALSAQFNHPTGACIDKNFNLYVGDYYNHRVRKIALGNCNSEGTGVNDVSENEKRITLFPNPANDFLQIDNVATQTNYRLLNLVGSSVQQGILGQGSNSISVRSLPAGMYLLEVMDDEGRREVRKVVKE